MSDLRSLCVSPHISYTKVGAVLLIIAFSAVSGWQQPKLPVHSVSQQMIRILLVDDDIDFCHILKESLEAASDNLRLTHLAHDTEDAVRLIDYSLHLFDCIIMDLALPRSAIDTFIERDSGLKLLGYLRAGKRFAGSIVMLTASCAFADGRMAFELGCDAYLTKPRELDDLVAALQVCIEKRVIVMSPEMRHLFEAEQITAQEARLLDMLLEGDTWPEIARALGYKDGNSACSAADRAFDKLLTWHDLAYAAPGLKKRQLALRLWKWRNRAAQDTAGLLSGEDQPEISETGSTFSN